MGHRPLTGYHVYAFTIPMVILHLPFGMGVDWSLSAELATIAKYFVLAVVWDYCWFVLNPAYTVKRFKRDNGHVWLLPHNEDFSPIPGDKAEIMGKIVSVFRKL